MLLYLPCYLPYKIPNIETDRSEQTVQTQIRLLLQEQSDLGVHYLPVHPHLLDALHYCIAEPNTLIFVTPASGMAQYRPPIFRQLVCASICL